MLGLIREMLRKGLMENEHYSDNDIIDFDDIDLAWEFNRLNKLLFDGKCKEVPLELSMRRMAHGHVSATINRLTGQITIKKLAISKFYNIPYKLFKDTFAHEMIHVYLLQQNINDNHGTYFHREMNRINGMGLGFNISVTSDAGNLDPSSSVRGRDVVFLIFKENSGSNISVMLPNSYYRHGNTIGNIFSYAVRKGRYKEFMAEFYMSNSPLLRKFTIQRSFNTGIAHNPISNETLEKILENSNKISELYTDGKEIIWDGKKPYNS
jgi:hypothetical protein